MSSLLVVAIYLHIDIFIIDYSNTKINRLATHLAIFDIVLHFDGTIDQDLQRFTAIRAPDTPGFQLVGHAPESTRSVMRQSG